MSFNTHQKSTKPPTTLNPHAAEFVPFTLRSPSLPESSSSAASRHSDEEEEARQFWNHQLPDDITRDFNLMTQDNDYDDSGSFSLASLSLDEAEKFPCASQGRGRFMFSDQPGEHNANGNGEMEVGPVDFLASQFPGFASESLAQVYFANGCDLHSTLEMLTQLELQVDGGGLNQKRSPKSFAAPNLTPMDFPALSQGDGLQQQKDNNNMFFFKSDYVSAVKKLASPDSGMWKYQPNDSADSSAIGSSRNSLPLAGGAYKSGSMYSDKLHNRAPSRPAPVWLETGDAVGNMYSKYREEARDYARLRNVYFEQARQAYLVGNKALAKDLSAKGQLQNLQMKAAHEKAQEAIYRQRNPVGEGGSERIIDLHGLHVSEALQVLKQELSVLRSKARATQERLQVYICVGTGHHTRGSRTPARLPVAVQRYLLEGEGLDYSEPQAGLLRVIIY
ncbi:CTC-interacting domain 7 [Raphanus sativus]|uniref:Polyadenylate-binding protein-interacting protein 7-like n=1 Tax=Raphanus sativus TaxID=3726 RepID=A0A6J0NIG9_RAPSA|nr:polyadenylate-binding protein-interacting protein 7-like [Raphanus sativus]XP_018483592.1 polyadenylate-binding protein-interacting protein 7-like [Raphanus sativus]XP_018483593.1 polyadenylate-binding protein-interacting protein 7-like [Raphanus sativus]KAJ4903048.1 CTC-interacting domain 7 [Raphanus sativus]